MYRMANKRACQCGAGACACNSGGVGAGGVAGIGPAGSEDSQKYMHEIVGHWYYIRDSSRYVARSCIYPDGVVCREGV